MQNTSVGRQTVSQQAGRHRVSILMSIVLLIALSVVPGSAVQAQVECLGACEAEFAACMGASGPGRPDQASMVCQDTYESCVDGCLGSFAALLG